MRIEQINFSLLFNDYFFEKIRRERERERERERVHLL